MLLLTLRRAQKERMIYRFFGDEDIWTNIAWLKPQQPLSWNCAWAEKLLHHKKISESADDFSLLSALRTFVLTQTDLSSKQNNHLDIDSLWNMGLQRLAYVSKNYDMQLIFFFFENRKQATDCDGCVFSQI